MLTQKRYRVDSLYSDTHKIRGGLNRNMKENEKEDEDSKNPDQAAKHKGKENMQGSLTLDTEANITRDNFDLEFSCDPLFRKATAKFDESSAKGLTQNVSKLSNKGLEVMFYTGNANSEVGGVVKEAPRNPLENVVRKQYENKLVSFATEALKGATFEEFSGKKINDSLVKYKHEKLNFPYPALDLTPFSVAQSSFTQSTKKTDAPESKLMRPEIVGPEDNQHLARINNEKTGGELLALDFAGTQEAVQTFDEVISFNTIT